MSTPPLPQPPVPAAPSGTALRTSRLAGVVLVMTLAAGMLSCAWLMVRGPVEWLPSVVSRESLLEGDVTHHFAKQLSKAALPAWAADLERASSWLLFRDLGTRVRQGCPGWLFLADELKINRHAQDNADDKLQAVVAVQQRLARQGIRLLVAVVPDKSRIAGAQLCGLSRPAQLANRAGDWTSALQRAGVAAVDLAPVLQPLGADAYLRTDTHWSESGARAAASAVAGQVRVLGIEPTPQKDFEVRQTDEAPRPGDLVRLAGVSWLPLNWQPTPERVAASDITESQQTAQGGDDLDDLFGDTGLPNLALIGTSFSRNSNFVGFLQLALSAPVGNFAKDGGEFAGSANQYFANPAFSQTPPKLLIWEIPERDLQTPYGERVVWGEGK